MATLKKLTHDEMFLISGGKRCTDNSKSRREKRERTGFEKALADKANRYGRAGKISGGLDIAGSIGSSMLNGGSSANWGC